MARGVATCVVPTQGTFDGQLEAGVRVFDVRVQRMNSLSHASAAGALRIGHGGFDLGASLDDVERVLEGFVAARPSEFQRLCKLRLCAACGRVETRAHRACLQTQPRL